MISRYLLTISCQQKNIKVNKSDIDQVVDWLRQCGVTFQGIHYENHGLYSQLHIHAVVNYSGRYSLLSKYGDEKLWMSFRIHFSLIRGPLDRVLQYLNKQDTLSVLSWNKFKDVYFNQDTQKFEHCFPLRRKNVSLKKLFSHSAPLGAETF